MEKRKKILLTTPISKCQWFSLSKEDKFGNYTCNLILEDSPETHKLISKIESLGEGKMPFKQEDDGSYSLKLKLKAKGVRKDGTTYEVNPPAIYNAMGQRMSGQELAGLSVGNGSLVRAKIELSAYTFMGNSGISCKPKSVQIAKLIEFNGGGEDLGFDSLELESTDDVVEEESGDYDF